MYKLHALPDIGAELAVGTRRRLIQICEIDRIDDIEDASKTYIYHSYTTDFERASDVLWKLGLADAYIKNAPEGACFLSYKAWEAASWRKKRYFPAAFRLASEVETRTLMKEWNGDKNVSFDDLLAVYLALAIDYGKDGHRLELDAGSTEPPEEFQHELDALIKHGYAVQTAQGIKWTSKIQQALVLMNS